MEFTDGKVMMGKIEILKEITWESILAKLPFEKLVDILAGSQLDGIGKLTMIPLSDIWEKVLMSTFPGCRPQRKPLAFFDPSDQASVTRKISPEP